MKRTTIKYLGGKERCPKAGCGGQITYGAAVTERLPIGFGFVGSRFQIDAVKRNGFGGECMECGAKVFAVQKQSHVVTYPKLGKKHSTKQPTRPLETAIAEKAVTMKTKKAVSKAGTKNGSKGGNGGAITATLQKVKDCHSVVRFGIDDKESPIRFSQVYVERPMADNWTEIVVTVTGR